LLLVLLLVVLLLVVLLVLLLLSSKARVSERLKASPTLSVVEDAVEDAVEDRGVAEVEVEVDTIGAPPPSAAPILKQGTSFVRLYHTPAASATAVASFNTPDASMSAAVSVAPLPVALPQSTSTEIAPRRAVNLTSVLFPVTVMPRSSLRPLSLHATRIGHAGRGVGSPGRSE
jgi:hypothetical protein